MKKDVLQEYISLQAALHREREELVGRLRQIDDVLGQQSAYGASTTPRVGRRGKGINNMSLKDAVLRVTATRAMTKQEVYEAVQKLGYQFGGKDPLNSLGVVLYGKNPRFRNEAGRFSPISLPSNGIGIARETTPSTGRRNTMSAAARERIAAAQRARWARQKGLTGEEGSIKPRRKMSAAGRARIAAAARERWAKFRAAK
jgi:hypothetical protein